MALPLSLNPLDPRTWMLGACVLGAAAVGLGRWVEARAAYHGASDGGGATGASEPELHAWLSFRSQRMGFLCGKVGYTLLAMGGISLWLALWTL